MKSPLRGDRRRHAPQLSGQGPQGIAAPNSIARIAGLLDNSGYLGHINSTDRARRTVELVSGRRSGGQIAGAHC